MSKIFIYGVPGSGKTSVSLALSESLNVPYVEADRIRAIAKQGRSAESDPFLFLPTTEAWKAIGDRTPENVIQGLLRVREAIRSFVDAEIASLQDGYVFESAFLDPRHLKDVAKVMLIVVQSEERHRKQFLTHRTEDAFTNERFENARIIQDFLIVEAGTLGIPVISNTADIASLVAQAKKRVIS